MKQLASAAEFLSTLRLLNAASVMITLLWTALNVVLFILFLYAWVRVIKVLQREIGLGFALIFALGLLSSKGSNPGVDSNRNLLASAKPQQEIGNWGTTQRLPMNRHNQLTVRIEAQRTDSTTRPLGLYTGVSGLLAGHNWKPIGGLINSEDHKLYYQVHMLHEWKLLSLTLYTSSEEYAGDVAVANVQ